MADHLGRVVSALRGLTGEIDAVTIAEALWLASHGPERAGSAESAPADRTSAHTAPRRPSAPADRPVRPDHDEPSATLYAGPPGPLPARPVSVPRAQALPRTVDIARALRPFKRPWSAGTARSLDIDATVDGYAHSGELLPVFRPTPERWFEVVLVVDRSRSMAVWQDTTAELSTTLGGVGAFRQVRNLSLSFDGASVELRGPRGQLADLSRSPANSARRLVLVVSDFAAPAWRETAAWQLLSRWAKAGPLALVDPLPAKLWRRTGLDLPAVRVTTAVPGVRNSALAFTVPLLLRMHTVNVPSWLPMPVLAPTPHAIGQWAQGLMRGHPGGFEAVLVPAQGRIPAADRRPGPSVRPADPVAAFLHTASPDAVRLAVLCAAFGHVSLPLLHLVRHVMVPTATVGDVAELVVSGLVDTSESAGGPPVFSLRDDARARLRSRLTRSELRQTHEVISRYIATHAGGMGGMGTFPATWSDPADVAALPDDLQPFALASAETLRLLRATARPVRSSAGTAAARPAESGTAAGADRAPELGASARPTSADRAEGTPYCMTVWTETEHASVVALIDEELRALLQADGYRLHPPADRPLGTRHRLGTRALLDEDAGPLLSGPGVYTRRRLRTPVASSTHQLTITVATPDGHGSWVRIEADHLPARGVPRVGPAPIPGLVRSLLPQLAAFDGPSPVRVQPRIVTPGQVDRLIEELCDHRRHLPTVVATVPAEIPVEDWLVTVVEPLMRHLPGLATLYLLDSEATPLFNLALEHHKVYGGAARTYLPGVHPGSRSDGARHPVLPRHRIEEDLRRAAALIAREPRRLAAFRPLPGALAAVPVLTLAPESRLSLVAPGSARLTDTPTAGRGSAPAGFAELIGRLDEFPLLQFTGEEKETLALDGVRTNDSWVMDTWTGLQALQEYAAAAVCGEAGGDFKHWCENTPPGCHRFPPRKAVRGESRTVTGHAKWRRQRMLPVPEHVDVSRRAFMGAHLRIGGGTAGPRVYYLDDCSGSGRIYIGYIGLHLTNTRTD
ncbi:SAV_2336 N-terminal domain-related protein [Kitasatospora sp. P5_F3]